MKLNSLAVFVSLLFGFNSVMTQGNHLHQTVGKVKFHHLADDKVAIPEIVDQSEIDVTHPLCPKPINPSDRPSLRIHFVSAFDFGVWGSTRQKIVAYAKAQVIPMKDGSLRDIAPFITTIDCRGSERGTGWHLEVSASALQDSKKNILKGAEIILANAYYEEELLAPTVNQSELNISHGPQTLATSNSETGSGQWPLSLGRLKKVTTQIPNKNNPKKLETITYTVTDGVRIEIPSNTVTTADNYTGQILWELVSAI